LHGGGLHLKVNGDGARSWIFRYRINGKRRDMGLRSTSAFTLIPGDPRRHGEGDLILRVWYKDGRHRADLDPGEQRRARYGSEAFDHTGRAAGTSSFWPGSSSRLAPGAAWCQGWRIAKQQRNQSRPGLSGACRKTLLTYLTACGQREP
jgi:hypothetical protein